MKYFKTSASKTADRYEINSKEFVRRTQNKFPYVQVSAKNKISQYAICPSCLNPIQLVGVDRQISCQPYGKHAGKSIDGLPEWDFKMYRYCPYAQKKDKRKPNDKERLLISEEVIELYELLKANFDRVVYVIQKELKIDCSAAFWEKTLQQYVCSDGYCYPWLSEANLPYIFAYIGMQHALLLGQKFIVDTDVYKVLQKQENTNFIYILNKDGKERLRSKYRRLSGNGYIDYHFRFTSHKQKAVEGKTLVETMDFCIDDMSNNKEIYSRTISFSENYFMNVVKKAGNENKRNKRLLDIAEKIMTPLKMQINIPKMREKILEGINTPIEECIPEDEVQW